VTGADRDGWVRTARDGAVLTVTLDRPDRLNAQTPATWAALATITTADCIGWFSHCGYATLDQGS